MKKLATVSSAIALTATLAAHASADGPARTTPPSAQPPGPVFTPTSLPKGIRLRTDGRYVQDVCDHSLAHFCFAHRVLPPEYVPFGPIPVLPQAGTTPPTGALSPSDIQALYKIPASSSGNGRVVAIVDSPDSHAFSDLNGYRTGYGIPALPKCANNKPTGTLPACFAQVNYDGKASTGTDSGQGDLETSLDMDMISAGCPDCSILLVEIPPLQSATNANFIQAAATAASLGAKATSYSLGGPEAADPKCGQAGSTDPTGYTTPGHLVMAASGDFGYLEENFPQANGGPCASPSYPSTAADVLSIGGTTVTGSGGSFAEKVWNDGNGGQDSTTSGCSTITAMPSWQTSLLAGSGCSMRASADLSAVAAFNPPGTANTDIAVYDSANANGFSGGVEGTSASSPLVAAILTRLNLTDQVAASFGWVYQHAAAFNDVTSGNDDDNGTCTNLLCKAQAGWDGPTGVGTPNGTALAALGGASGCTNNSACSGATPVCNTTTGVCQACASDGDCPGAHCATGASDPNKGKCVQCTTSAQCTSAAPVCSTTADTCGPCATSSDCTDPSKPVCSSGACVAGPGGGGSDGGSGSGSGGGSGGGSGSGSGGSTADAGGSSGGVTEDGGFGGADASGNTNFDNLNGNSSGCACSEQGGGSRGAGFAVALGMVALAGARRRRRD